MIQPWELALGASILATIIAEDLSVDELDILVIALAQLEDSLALIAVQRRQGESAAIPPLGQ